MSFCPALWPCGEGGKGSDTQPDRPRSDLLDHGCCGRGVLGQAEPRTCHGGWFHLLCLPFVSPGLRRLS